MAKNKVVLVLVSISISSTSILEKKILFIKINYWIFNNENMMFRNYINEKKINV